MFNSMVLDTAIGLFFVYLIVSIISSGLAEYIADRIFSLRAKNMQDALSHMLVGSKEETQDRNFIDRFIQNALFQSLSQKGSLPSYMTSKRFMQIVIDLVTSDKLTNDKGMFQAASLDEIAKSVEKLPDTRAKDALGALLKQTDDKIETFEKSLEDWFNETMERASGWYKRKIRWILFLSAFVVSIGLNADTFQIISELSQSPEMRTKIVELASQTVKGKTVGEIKLDEAKKIAQNAASSGIIGWELDKYQKQWAEMEMPESFNFILLKFLGLLITAGAASLGAPFWFDLLNKLVNLRNAGKTLKEPPKKVK